MKRDIIPILVIVISLGACEREYTHNQTDKENEVSNFIFINNDYSVEKVDFHVRIYFPKEDLTDFVNKIKEYQEGDVLPDSLILRINQPIYQNCYYQLMIYVLIDNKFKQYTSKNIYIKEKVDSVFYFNWPNDSILLDRID